MNVLNWTRMFETNPSLIIVHEQQYLAVDFLWKIDIIEIVFSKLFSEVDRKYF